MKTAVHIDRWFPFLAVALSNNTLSQKTAAVSIVLVLLVAYLQAVPQLSRPDTRR